MIGGTMEFKMYQVNGYVCMTFCSGSLGALLIAVLDSVRLSLARFILEV
jgi:hypothetical protein